MINRTFLMLLITLGPLVLCARAFDFAPGHFYVSDGANPYIDEFDQNGSFVSALSLSTNYYATDPMIHGLTFGQDGLLYAATTTYQTIGQTVIDAINSSGQIQRTYQVNADISGARYSGKLEFTPYGELYLGATTGLFGIDPKAGTNTQILSGNSVNDIVPLPNADLFVLQNSSASILDPQSGTLSQYNFYTGGEDLRGAAYNPLDDSLYVSVLDTASIDKFKFSSKELLGSAIFNDPDDIVIDSDGHIVVGSGGQVPAFFDANLNLLSQFTPTNVGQFGDRFVTQYTVPEPSAILLAAFAAIGLGSSAKRLGRRRLALANWRAN
jgi:hypothetical protein